MDQHSLLQVYAQLNENDSESEQNGRNSASADDQMDQHQLSTKISFALSFVTLIFSVTGTITNGVSLFLYTRPTMRSSMNVLLAGLSAFDMCFSVLSIPTFVVPPMCVYKPDEWGILCDVTTFSTLYVYGFVNMFKTAGIWTLVYITVQRWLTVRRPFCRARGSSLTLAKRALMAIFLAALIYNTPRFFEHLPLNEANSKEYIKVKEYLRQYPIYMSLYYSILYLLTHFVIPFTVLAFINGTMTCAIRRALKANRALSHSERAAAMMATLVLVFACCNTLPFVMNFVEFIDRDLWVHHETKIGLWAVNDISNILLLVGATSNAFIYYFCNRKYAQVLKRYVSESYQLAKDRFNYPGAQPVSRYRMVASHRIQRRPLGGFNRRQPSSTPTPPPFPVFTGKPKMVKTHFDRPVENDRSGAFSFDQCHRNGQPERGLRHSRSRSVLALAWRATGRLRSGAIMGRSLSSTALTMVEQQAALRQPLAGLIPKSDALFCHRDTHDLALAVSQGKSRWTKAPAISMGSLL